MNPNELIEKLDDARIAASIAEAERQTSGEIRVCVSHRRRDDALNAARRRFQKLGMERTRHRNAVLIFFAPLTQQFAVWGDVGVHARCGADCWQGIVGEMSPLLKEGRFTDAVVLAVQRVGAQLARHFPHEAGDINELPNKVVED